MTTETAAPPAVHVSAVTLWLVAWFASQRTEQTKSGIDIPIDGPQTLALMPAAQHGLVRITPDPVTQPHTAQTLTLFRRVSLTDAGRAVAASLDPLPRQPRASRILAAAIRPTDGPLLTLPPPARHADIARAAASHEIFLGHLDRLAYGFATDLGQFTTRRRAYDIACAAGQLLTTGTSRHNGLYTDDVW